MTENSSNSHHNITSSVCVIRGNETAVGGMLDAFLQELGLRTVTKDIAAILTGYGSPFVDSIMDEIFEHVQAVIILLSGDEEVRLSNKLLKDKQLTAKNNFSSSPMLDLVFGAGYAFARNPQHTILLRTDNIGHLSDIDGRYIKNFTGSPEDQRHLLLTLQSIGCNMTPSADIRFSLGLYGEDILTITNKSQGAFFTDRYFELENLAGEDREITYSTDARKIFVIYGRNKLVKEAVFGFLRSLGLVPIEWEEAILDTESGSPYIGQILEALLRQAQATLVLLTGDDEVKQKNKRNLQPILQPRPNVVFETGMAYGDSWLKNQTILLGFGEVRIWPWLTGRHRFSHGNDARHYWNVVNTLDHLGCKIKIANGDTARKMWISISRYY